MFYGAKTALFMVPRSTTSVQGASHPCCLHRQQNSERACCPCCLHCPPASTLCLTQTHHGRKNSLAGAALSLSHSEDLSTFVLKAWVLEKDLRGGSWDEVDECCWHAGESKCEPAVRGWFHILSWSV